MASEPRPKEKNDNIALAVGVIVFTVFCLSLGDALIKLSSNSFVIWQIFVVRSLIAIPCLLVFMRVYGGAKFAMPKEPFWTAVRSILLVIMWVIYYASLPHLSLAAAATAYYTLPIFITLFSALLLGDAIKLKGWVAVLLGFMGIVFILKPSAADFNGYALLPIASAILYALAMILTRTKCRSEHPLMLSFGMNVAFVLLGGFAALVISTLPSELRHGFLLAPWAPMGNSEWVTMCVLAIAILIGSIGAGVAYQNGPPSVVGIFDFAYVGFAVLWGIVLFAEFPDASSIIGMLLIVVAGFISLRQA